MSDIKQTKRENDDEMFLVDDDDDSTQQNKYLLFQLGEEAYGLNIMTVTDIIELQKITKVPDLPDFIRGIINLRGRIIPVMDLRIRFNMPEREYDDRTCIIIVGLDQGSIGFIVDTVNEVQDILPKDIDPPPSFKSGSVRERYIQGLGKVQDQVKILLDVEKVVGNEELLDAEQYENIDA
ncbi:chemotaxis protein CheW [Salinispira pacifica]|uniref:Chemotaxis protein CheW n=1 Tax=Salinispira pacifica TaxID=1307761 RepID=V5WJ83_9SPIO|nr:chemotaxis protein CheW [Salinispira pacifica]AHC15892.1 Positive regulator of CheA protein activity (CheW) [Salinispira pacifica]